MWMNALANKTKHYQMKFFVVIFTFLLSTFGAFAQKHETDSLLQLVGKTKDSKEKALLFLEASKLYRSVSFDTSHYYINRAKAIAIKDDLKPEIGKSYVIEARLLAANQRFIEAIQQYENALPFYSLQEHPNELAYIYSRLTSIYKNIGGYSTALEYGLKSIVLYQKTQDSIGLRRINNTLGSVYRYLGDYDKAVSYYAKSLEISELNNYLPGVAAALNNWGLVYKTKGEDDMALQYYQRSYEIEKKLGDADGQAIYFNNAGMIYMNRGDLDTALQCFLKAYNLRTNTDSDRRQINTLDNLGDYYALTGEFKKSITYYTKGLAMSKEMKLLGLQREIRKSMANAYEKKGDYKEALFNQKIFKKLNDSLFNSDNALRYAQLELDFNRKEKLKEQQFAKRKFWYIISFLVGVLCIVILLFLLFYSKSKSRSMELLIQQRELSNENKYVQQALELRNKELVTFSMEIAHHHEISESVVNRLENSMNKLKKDNRPIIQQIINEIKTDLKHKGWKDFEMRFLEVHQSFYENLLADFPTLTQNEKRLSAFLKLDLSTKEISDITGQTPHTINVARTRLRKKLNLANTDQSLFEFLAKY
jgi:tetratricopeptide (TPR) repeat protein